MSDQWKTGNKFAPYHPSASHIRPDYRDGWNACYELATNEIERLTVERNDLRRQLSEWLRENSPGGWIDDLRRQLAEAEQDARRFDWLAERLEDVQIDDANPLEHYHGDEEDVPYSVLWRRAIDAAMGASNA